MIGLFHEEGWVVPVNRTLAAHHYARAAEGGDFRGAFNHARMLLDAGRIDGAERWFDQARALAREAGNTRFLAQMATWLTAEGFTPISANANDLQEDMFASA